MNRYLNIYDTMWQAKRDGKRLPPKLDHTMRVRIETALAATRIKTVFESPAKSRLWREFQAVCRQLDRTK